MIVALIFLLSLSFSAQSAYSYPFQIHSKATLKGTILDAKESRVPNAIIILKGRKSYRKLKSNEAGEFEIELPPGIYQITVDARSLGFSLFQEKGIKISAGELNFISRLAI
jgi:hypothetical protein